MKRILTAGTVAAACLLGGCTPEGGASPPATTPSSVQSSSSTTPTVSITPTPSAEEQAADAVVRFWAELDRVSADPNIPLSELTSVAGDQALRQWQVVMTQERGQGHRSVGATQVISPTATHDAATGTYRVVACVDVSKVNVVDQDGKSVVSPNRPPRTKYTYEVSRVEGSYFVVKDSLEGEPC